MGARRHSAQRRDGELGKLEEWTFYRKTEILGLIRFMVLLAFIIQLMVEFGPHTVAP